MTENTPEELPDRPLECDKCKKSIKVVYTEIIKGQITHTGMCEECPELQRRLHGITPSDYVFSQQDGENAGLCCGTCGTTLGEVKRGHLLGCDECYDVFADLIINEMLDSNKLSLKYANAKKGMPIHIGRAPGESLTISPSSRLLALNEALKETLNREEYEQAAWLRDQIKAITEDVKKDKDIDKKKDNDIGVGGGEGNKS